MRTDKLVRGGGVPPGRPTENYVKRCIGLPETLEMRNDTVYIDGSTCPASPGNATS